MLNKITLLDLIRSFTVFEKSKSEDPKTGITTIKTIKKIAAYHQYYAVNKAVESTIRATGFNQMSNCVAEPPAKYGLRDVVEQPEGDHKAGVVWHTQGSGKSLSMVFYTGKVVQKLNNPTMSSLPIAMTWTTSCLIPLRHQNSYFVKLRYKLKIEMN